MFRRVGRSDGLAERTDWCERAGSYLHKLGTTFLRGLAVLALSALSTFAIAASVDDTSSNNAAQNAEPSASNSSGSKPKFDWESARVEFGAESIVIKEPQFEISVPAASHGTSAVADPELLYAILRPAFRALDGIKVNRIEIVDGVVTVRQSGAQLQKLTGLEASFDIRQAAGLTTGSGSFTLRGEKLTFDTAFAKPDPESATGDIPLRLTVSGAGLDASFKGVARHDTGAQLEGDVDVTIKDLRKLARWSGFTLSDGAGLNTFRTQGKMNWTAGLFAMSKGAFTLDGNAASGVLSLDLRKPRAAVEGTLALERLDLGRYFADNTTEKAEQTTVLGTLVPAIGTETPLQVPILQDFDADVRLSVNEIQAGAFRTGAGAITLTLRSGNLLADIAELEMFSGAIVGQLELNVTEPNVKISARGLLDNIEAGEAMRWITEVQAIRGRARMTANVAAQGRTLTELMRSMKGDARLTMLDGGAFQMDVDGLMKKADKQPLQGWGEANVRETEFGTLEARLLLENARISTRGLRADRDDTRIVAFGTINLAEQNLSVRMSIVEKPEDTNAATETAFTRGPTLTMQGPWDEPSISVEKQARSALPSAQKAGDALRTASALD